MHFKVFFTILLVSIVLVSGCSQKSTEVKEFKVKISHSGYIFYINERPVLKPSVNTGDTVRFFVTVQTDEEDHGHGITIDEYKINKAVSTANEKNSVVIEFVANKKGKFRIWCKTCLEGVYGSDHPEIEAVLEVK